MNRDAYPRYLDVYHAEDSAALADSLGLSLRAWVEEGALFRAAVDAYRTGGDKEALVALLNEKLNLRTCLRMVAAPEGPYMMPEPSDPIGALWLQLADAVVGGAVIRACASCSKLLEVGCNGRRGDSYTCSNRCRVRAQRAGLRFRKEGS